MIENVVGPRKSQGGVLQPAGLRKQKYDQICIIINHCALLKMI
jgi:hypothetical protein